MTLTVCEPWIVEHFQIMLAWRKAAFQKAWSECGDGLMCMHRTGGTTDPTEVFSWQRLS